MNPDDPLGLLTPPKKEGDPLGLLEHKPKIGQMGKAITEDASHDPSYAEKALGGISALAHDIPGAEALQAGARSFFRAHPSGEKKLGFQPTERDQSYTDALSDIKGAEEAAPKGVRMLNNVAGGTIAALAGPKGKFVNPLGTGGSAAVQGARFGAAQGLLSADPVSAEKRLLKAGKGGAIGGVTAGLLGDVAPNVARVIKAKSLGSNAMQRASQMADADGKTYGKALSQGRDFYQGPESIRGAALLHPDGVTVTEAPTHLDALLQANKTHRIQSGDFGIGSDGFVTSTGRFVSRQEAEALAEKAGQAAHTGSGLHSSGLNPAGVARPISPEVTAALDSPGIRGYANAARKSQSLAGADDATILHETYKRLGERQRALESQVERAANFKAGPAREVQDIELMKQRLLDAADKIMPGYRDAVTQHAKLAGETEVFQNAADQTRRVVNGTSVAGRNLGKNTGDAFKASIVKLDKEKAAAAREAVLGRVQEQAGDALNKNPLKGFGIPASLGKINRASPYLRQLDEQINPNSGQLRSALAVALGSHAGN